MSAGGSNKAVVAALGANLGIAVLKFAAWLLTGASSMLAEAIHSVADSGNQVLLLVGGRQSRREATEQHPFGFGRERYIYAFIVSIVLFSLGGVFALFEAYHKYHEVHAGHEDKLLTGQWWWVPLVVLAGAIVLEALSLRTAVREANLVRPEGLGWIKFVRTSKAPELPVVLFEDMAALVGLVLAFIGVGMAKLTDNSYWDAAGTAGIGLLLVTVAVLLAVEIKSLLVGEAANVEAVDRITRALGEEPLIERVIDLRTLHVGPDELLVAAKIAVKPSERSVDVASAIDAAERRIRSVEPIARYIYIEPDIFSADYRRDSRPEPPLPSAH